VWRALDSSVSNSTSKSIRIAEAECLLQAVFFAVVDRFAGLSRKITRYHISVMISVIDAALEAILFKSGVLRMIDW
jgi:hypothetical protein